MDALISISAAGLFTEGPTCTPMFSEGGQQTPWFYAKGLRHPTAGASVDAFVPNDVNLGGELHAPFMLLTGPNMGGKSTLLRQVCLAVILAQVIFPSNILLEKPCCQQHLVGFSNELVLDGTDWS